LSFTEKVDVLDLIINVTQEHEKKLDSLIETLEPLVERLEKAVEAITR